MTLDDQAWLSLADDFATAAFDGSWQSALERLAAATGSRSGELIGLGREAVVPFNILTNVDPQAIDDFITAGGGDPARNPRVRAGLSVPELKVLVEADIVGPEEHRHNPHYREWVWRYDLPYVCLTPLLRAPDLLIGLAVARSASQGHIGDPQRRLFATIAPHVRAAVRTQLLLADQGAALLAGALDAVSLTAFVCDADARIAALTPRAETLLREETQLRSQAGRLAAATVAETRLLQQAVSAAAYGLSRPGQPQLRTLLLRPRHQPSMPLVVDVIPLVRGEALFGSRPRALVIAGRGRRERAQTAAILQHAFGLTAAEADVALQLSDGNRPDAIAARRGVGVGTVRAQIKSAFAKAGVSGQVELVALIGQLQ